MLQVTKRSRKQKTIAGFVALPIVALVLAACSSINTSPSTSSAEAKPSKSELYARGKYLATSVVDCLHCHTKRSTADFSHEEGPEWAGGEIFGEGWPLPGVFVTPNITQDKETGLGNWTEGQIRNAIRNGVNQKGERLFPLMPSHFFQSMSDKDFDALVVYLQSLEPQKKPTDVKTEMTIPRSALPPLPPVTMPVAEPPANDPIARGKYFVTLANCITCHSPTGGGQELPGKHLAGGVLFQTPFGTFSTPNVTSDRDTGIGKYTDDELVRLFRTGVKRDGQKLLFNFMPWWIYKNMTDADLSAVISYLRTIPAVSNDVQRQENQIPLGS